MDAAELIAAAQEGIAKSDLQFDPALQRYFDPDLNLYYDPNDRRYTRHSWRHPVVKWYFQLL